MLDKSIDEKLDKLKKDFEELLYEPQGQVKDETPSHELTAEELRAWREGEPDFAKRIVTPLNPKHRGNRTAPEILYRRFVT